MNEEIARVLAQVVEVGPTVQEAALGAAVSQHVSSRPAERPSSDPETAAALRALGDVAVEAAQCSPLTVAVDVNALLADHGEPAMWRILGQLKDLFGGTP